MIGHRNLIKIRQQIERLREGSSRSIQHAHQISQSILSSWTRSKLANIPIERKSAPLISIDKRQPNILQRALLSCQDELQHIASQSSMVVAVGDIGSTILWTAASKKMQVAAENANFIEGGQWSEDVVGTNALALTLKTQKSCCVFSMEHYLEAVQDWVCYAAPIIDPFSKQLVGVVDLSTTWKSHNSLGVLAAERCASILQHSLMDSYREYLYIRTLNTPQISLNGHIVDLTPRQIEIICILTLSPQGMNLENLHHALYGDRPISMGTLKAEMSQLKDIFGQFLTSRPYKFKIDIDADFLQIEKALDAGYIETALKLYRGVFLVKTESPFLCAWRDCLESRLSEAIFNSNNSDILLKHLSHSPDAVDAVERLMELIPQHHLAHQNLLKYQKI
ncbi:hypothetical protein [Acinetobacter equi]|uniref:Transcriptional regulator n=1 Tax=Acinetobacter equi TaxID=1324350 RepID=A0A0N9VS42_9GAMM|nr:hypothetical protein [Acinetobacter equi]ALH96190.1 transcriptional regulator [Acinetobacter equi]